MHRSKQLAESFFVAVPGLLLPKKPVMCVSIVEDGPEPFIAHASASVVRYLVAFVAKGTPFAFRRIFGSAHYWLF